MIRLNCTNCKASLTMDDAFAGGVCRCQHCGTIQTVPKKSAAGVKGSATPMPNKALFQKKVRSDGAGISSGTGLDQLAEAVASSGLAGSGLTSGASGRMRTRLTEHESPPAPLSPAAQQQRRLMLLLGAGLGVVILLLAVVIILMLRGNSSPPANTPGSAANAYSSGAPPIAPSRTGSNARSAPPRNVAVAPASEPPPAGLVPAVRAPVTPGPALKAPHAGDQTFCDVALEGPVVIFLLDRGQATMETFDLMRVACERSLGTLTPRQKFQVIFWNNSSPPEIFPETGPAPATAQTIQKLRDRFDNIVAFGASDAMPSLAKALAAKPSTIVIVTGKLVDDDFAAAVLAAHKGSATKISAVLLGQKEDSEPLKKIAQTTGGQYKTVSEEQLQDYTQ